MIRTSKCENTIFSKYLALPIATFPIINELDRLRPGIFFLDKETVYQLTNTNSLRLAKFEMAQFVWKTNGLPLTYSRFIFNFRSTMVRT